ncbi:hypothetical protein NDU88_011640 [Pleurodeles waltl]|uniref:Uncharacterized protein n=1 Tax=Pleurodeles waltl TaxID=8319 RepID=A0AAV7S6T7_PLEWA|nr:hypothetical protein NDU88_011640 [Pleurodeles waltl]
MTDFSHQGSRGGTYRSEKLANCTRSEIVAGSDMEQEDEEEKNADLDISELEKEGERNTNTGIVAQEEE